VDGLTVYEERYNEDGTRRADPLTKIGIMLAIREMAFMSAGVRRNDPLGALQWALDRDILAVRSDVALERGKDDLVLTPLGQQLVTEFWELRDRERVARGMNRILGGRRGQRG